ncbi:hypothetical protein [Bradyrhizobium sp. CCBAU 51753]|uniref:hypothetical protein n=1 Tax=Bradyrhizobium sp. CCBAU 51753 TaxID=1325100 RepID=UPI00188CC1C8|nr:hypothetical protein [Bradyrhizobium sp. CCBAU 51753]QOZ25317.1 hypothetical protein XH93_18250 [Bradyrhizobium sp. CCBAU 51753]
MSAVKTVVWLGIAGFAASGFAGSACAAEPEFRKATNEISVAACNGVAQDAAAEVKATGRAPTDSYVNMIRDICLMNEQEAMDRAAALKQTVPATMWKACEDRVSAAPKKSFSNMMHCLDDDLQALPDSKLPAGTVIQFQSGRERRYWTLAECRKSTASTPCVAK